MIRKPFIFVFILTSMMMISCEEEYFIDAGDFESKLVVNALFNNDSPWKVHVSNTTNILDSTTDIENLTDAKVEIYDQNDEFLYELFHQESGYYGREDYAPSPKRGYSIKVSVVGYHTVTAKSFVPEKSTLLINNFSIITNEKYNDVEVDFEIEDRSMLESYYIWEIVNIDSGSSEFINNQLSQTWIDDLTNNPNSLIKGNREILEGNSFGDGTYQGTYNSTDGNRRRGNVGNNNPLGLNSLGEVHSLKKLDPDVILVNEIHLSDVYEDGSNHGGDPEIVEYKYELRVMSISKELYDYYSSVEEYLQNSKSNHSNQIPLDIYTNVSNGLGIFAGFSESVIQF